MSPFPVTDMDFTNRFEGYIGDWDMGGGQNVLNVRGRGEVAPKVAPRELGFLTPKLRIFFRISVERG